MQLKPIIKILLTVLLAFGITWGVFHTFNSPQQLSFGMKNILNSSKIYRNIAQIKTNDAPITIKSKTYSPVVRYVDAKEEKTVLYKGKLLKVKVFDKNDQPSQTVLDILYNIETEKERKAK